MEIQDRLARSRRAAESSTLARLYVAYQASKKDVSKPQKEEASVDKIHELKSRDREDFTENREETKNVTEGDASDEAFSKEKGAATPSSIELSTIPEEDEENISDGSSTEFDDVNIVFETQKCTNISFRVDPRVDNPKVWSPRVEGRDSRNAVPEVAREYSEGIIAYFPPNYSKPGILSPNNCNPGIKPPNNCNPVSKPPNDSTPGIKSPNDSKPGIKPPNDSKPGIKSPNDSKPGIKSPNDSKPGIKPPNNCNPGIKPPNDSKPGIKSANDSKPGIKPPNDCNPGSKLQKDSKSKPQNDFKHGSKPPNNYNPGVKPPNDCNSGSKQQNDSKPGSKEETTDKNHEVEVDFSNLGIYDTPIDWSKVTLTPKPLLERLVYDQLSNCQNPDFIVTIASVQFLCNLIVLKSYSSYFEQVTGSAMSLPEEKVSPDNFYFVYTWMVNEGDASSTIGMDNIFEILKVTQFLGIEDLEKQCWSFLQDEVFTGDAAVLMYQEGKKQGCADTRDLLLSRVDRFFLPLVSSTDYLAFDPEEVCTLLRSSNIGVHSEIEVFMSAVRWLMHDWEERSKWACDVMKCVRFALIPAWKVVELRRDLSNPEFLRVTNIPEVKKIIDEGFSRAVIKHLPDGEKGGISPHLYRQGSANLPLRNWIEGGGLFVKLFIVWSAGDRKVWIPVSRSGALRDDFFSLPKWFSTRPPRLRRDRVLNPGPPSTEV